MSPVSLVLGMFKALLDLLKSEPLEACKSIIVYCTRRQTTENIAEMLRSMLGPRDFPTIGKKRRRKADSMYVEAYHAGMEASHRTRVQRNFMSGELRIVVATVAFGMGLDKSDIRAIVHFDMPSSLESYVQEIGRAGRDGNVSFCHVFLDQKVCLMVQLFAACASVVFLSFRELNILYTICLIAGGGACLFLQLAYTDP